MKARIVTPESKFTIINNSAASEVNTAVSYNGPVIFVASASEKGTEDITIIEPSADGSLFPKKFGNPSFQKYGQESITAGILSDDGAKVIFKRIVAEDALLANLVIYTQLIKEEKQKVDGEGYPLYTDADGNETIVSEGNTPLTETVIKVKHIANSLKNIKSLKDLVTLVKSTLDEDAMIYPRFVIADNGRGLSNKRVRISVDYNTTKRLSYMKYKLTVLEKANEIENFSFCSNPNITEYSKNLSINTVITENSDQIKCDLFESYQDMMVDKLSELTGYEFEELNNYDLFNCTDRTGAPLVGIELAEDSANLSYAFGLPLENGSNGSFGNFPINTNEYHQELLKFFNGQITTDVYDIDNYKIDIIPDCNYPFDVKMAILELCKFRIDPYFFGDMGTDLDNYNDILVTADQYINDGFDTMFGSFSHLAYDIKDPYTKKQIRVTYALEYAERAIKHFEDGRSRPFAGSKFGIEFKRWIPGTENFRPIQLPAVKQKDEFIEKRINYATKYSGKLIMDLQLTSEQQNTEASFINNIFNIQQIIKEIRELCPSTRYSFIEEEDLEDYKDTVNSRILSKYTSNFKTLELIYLQDETAKQNKVFLAALNVEFKDFVQQEQFMIYLTNGNSSTATNTTV